MYYVFSMFYFLQDNEIEETHLEEAAEKAKETMHWLENSKAVNININNIIWY